MALVEIDALLSHTFIELADEKKDLLLHLTDLKKVKPDAIMIRIFLFLLFLAAPRFASAQTDAFNALYNGLLFNMYSGEPDSIVVPFLKIHFPYLVNKTESGSWVIYPPANTDKVQRGFHSVNIDQHPMIKQAHSGARFDIFSQEWPAGNPGIEKTRVWLIFPDAKAAQLVYDSLITAFRNSNARIAYDTVNKERRTRIQPGLAEEDSISLSLIIKKMSAPDRYAILFLFMGDKGEPW